MSRAFYSFLFARHNFIERRKEKEIYNFSYYLLPIHISLEHSIKSNRIYFTSRSSSKSLPSESADKTSLERNVNIVMPGKWNRESSASIANDFDDSSKKKARKDGYIFIEYSSKNLYDRRLDVKVYLVYVSNNNYYYPVCGGTFVQEVICIPIHLFNGTLTESAIDFSSVLSFSLANTRLQACILLQRGNSLEAYHIVYKPQRAIIYAKSCVALVTKPVIHTCESFFLFFCTACHLRAYVYLYILLSYRICHSSVLLHYE